MTVTSTVAATPVKRDAEPVITEGLSMRGVIEENFQVFARQANETYNATVMSASFSSACNCHDYTGTSTVTESYTNEASVCNCNARFVFCH